MARLDLHRSLIMRRDHEARLKVWGYFLLLSLDTRLFLGYSDLESEVGKQNGTAQKA